MAVRRLLGGSTRLLLVLVIGPVLVPLWKNLVAVVEVSSSLPESLETAMVLPARLPAKEQLQADSFAACLLTMDDNHFLIEWLAYHYHTLPLRHLIVAIDPNGKTSPTHIFDKWRRQGMIIEEWTDVDYMPELLGINITALPTNKSVVDLLLHKRQRTFYTACMKKLKAANRTWTLFLDSDEYLVINKRKSRHAMDQPGVVMKLLRNESSESPCIMMPRLRFGIKESATTNTTLISSNLNASAFQTLRFQYHAATDNFTLNKIAKSMLDISKIPSNEMIVKDPHRLVWKYCPEPGLLRRVENSPFVVHHYLGTWEQYTFRNDVRKGGNRSKKSFDLYKDVNAGKDDSIQPWLNGFVKDVGLDIALHLLENVGEVSPKDDSFSACLLMMDDNHHLIEWLAYHYYTLPLRHLIVAVDPRSTTRPTAILDRWRDEHIVIQEWSDEDFMPTEGELANTSEYYKTEKDTVWLHRQRQKIFYEACMKELKQAGKTWTLLTDTDEYLLINARAVKRFNVSDAPAMDQPGAVMSLLKRELLKQKTPIPKTTPCIMIPRLRYGSKESSRKRLLQGVPPGFNASVFQTMRFRKHALPHEDNFNKLSKAIIDVSRVDYDKIVVKNPHRPLWDYCPKEFLRPRHRDNLFIIHHYTGTWEQWNFRKDSRNMRNTTEFHKLSMINNNDDGSIRPWLTGFVGQMGTTKAAALLKDAGHVPPKANGQRIVE